MENTTTNNNVIEVLTELTVSDIPVLQQIIETCLQVKLFTEESRNTVEELLTKIKNVSQILEEQS